MEEINNKYNWIQVAQRIQAIAQTGLEFCKNEYDLERYRELREISVDIFKNHSLHTEQEIVNFFASETGYPTPKIDVRAAIFHDEKILMVREKIDGRWSLPGGWADQNHSLSENLIKESMEEAGVEVNPERVIAILDRNRYTSPPVPQGCYKIFVECKLIGGGFSDNSETSEAGYFGINKLPPLSVERNTQKQIEMCFDAHSGNKDVIFD